MTTKPDVKVGQRLEVELTHEHFDFVEVIGVIETGVLYYRANVGGEGMRDVRFAQWSAVKQPEPPKAEAGVMYEGPDGTGYIGLPNGKVILCGTLWRKALEKSVKDFSSDMTKIAEVAR